MRRRFVVGNLKMNLTGEAISALVGEVARNVGDHAEVVEPTVVLCPPSPYLFMAVGASRDSQVMIGAQDCHHCSHGAYTGDVSAAMVADAGCRFVIVGHSERRRDHHEDDVQIAKKAHMATEVGLVPIVCVGETHAEYLDGAGLEVVQRQVERILAHAGSDVISSAVLAYEPVWAIGTGLAATPEYAQQMHSHIRATLRASQCDSISILYGGSVTAENATSLFACEDVDGALVGGASLVSTSFNAIVNACRSSVA